MALIRDFISIGQINKPVQHIAAHQHNVWELVYYTYGYGIMTVGKCQYAFKKGDIMLLPADIPHSEKSDHGYRNYYMLFARSGLPKKENSVFQASDNDGLDAFHLIQLIYRTFHLKPLNWPQILQRLQDALDAYLLVLSGENGKDLNVDKLESRIIDNLSNANFDLEKAMSELPVSKEYLRRKFKVHTGRPPLEYLVVKRLEYAAKLMETGKGSLRIKDIARMSGYKDPYYFSRVFRKTYGQSPRQWVNR